MTTSEEFDAMPTTEARQLVLGCAAVPRWVDEVVAARPYRSRSALLGAAEHRAGTWSDDEVSAALADHPRIGERPSGTGASAAAAVGEQAGVDRTDPDVATRLAAGNAAYEARFGRVFLVRAAGRDATEILALLESRLQHDAAAERAATAQALREIALLRLGAAVTDDAGAAA